MGTPLSPQKEKKASSDPQAGLRSFKKSTEIENLYRFINDNNLRREAKMILELVCQKLNVKKKKKKGRPKNIH